jgi:hypothetical protein
MGPPIGNLMAISRPSAIDCFGLYRPCPSLFLFLFSTQFFRDQTGPITSFLACLLVLDTPSIIYK